jgi:hypothetical protein
VENGILELECSATKSSRYTRCRHSAAKARNILRAGAAFLQADVIGRKFTKFPEEWRDLLRDYPELHQWIGMPLRLKKSLYGYRVANFAWDETQSKWLSSPEIGFTRLPSEGSIYIKSLNDDFITVLNAVDDQLYFATEPTLKTWFEEATQARFDVQLLGQANWYLQSRITQCTDYSIILDNSRYSALVLQRYLTGTSDADVTTKMKLQHAPPVPVATIFTKQDCSKTYSEVMEIQKEYGFEYAAVVGSLIYHMNTYIRLNYAIRKLARFMQYPGRNYSYIYYATCNVTDSKKESNFILTSQGPPYIDTSR